MKRKLKKIIILFLVFILGVAGTALLLNNEKTDDRSDMEDASFPEVMLDINGIYANRMCGYAHPMQTDFIRDCVTPLDNSRKLTFVVSPYKTKVNSLSYEIRTSDGSKVLENKKIINLKKDGNYLRAGIKIGSDLRMNQEYSMEISLDIGNKTAYYYTRIVSRSKVNAADYVAFVQGFYEACLDKNSADGLAAYLEPESTGNSTNYSDIDIHSSLNEISWGTMKPRLNKKGIPVIKDINETTASISLEYQITSKDDENNTEVYDVEEFYRMRYTDSRIRLLDFERSAAQVFDPSLPVFSDEGVLLGIRNRNVDYMVSENASVIAFAQQGDLWSYSPENGKAVQVFSFRKDTDEDFRSSRQQHDIKIIRISDEGNIDFAVYGYMNRGEHEGYNGVGIYYYNNDQNLVEEKAFVPISESYDFLKKDLGTLSYVNKQDQLFLLFAQRLYQIDIMNHTYEILEDGIENENFVISDTNAHAAWLVTQGEDEGKIKEIDFETKKIRFIQPEKGWQLRTVGFMNEDLIYGLLSDSDILTDSNGHISEGLQTLYIEDFDGNRKKEYHKEGMYVTDITVGGTLIEFGLSVKSGDTSYTVQKKDNIMNNSKTAQNNGRIEMSPYSRTGIRVKLAFEEKKDVTEPLVMYAKIRSIKEKEIQIDTQIPEKEMYYVYARGEFDNCYNDPAQAVQRADETGGVVLNRAQQYIWERGNKKTKIQFSIEDVPEIIRTGIWDKDKLQKELGDKGTVLDLSGCSLDSVLYEVSAQRPVIVRTGDKTSRVIVGYDEYNTYLYDPVSGETKPYGMNDSTKLFERSGNIFICYMESAN